VNPAAPGDAPAPGGMVDDRPSDFAAGDGPGETVSGYAQRVGKNRKTIEKQIERGNFDRLNPGYTVLRAPDRLLILPINQ